MSDKPIIGIVSRRGISKLDRNIFQAEDNYRRAILKCGGIPIMLMPCQDTYFPYDTTEKVPNLTLKEKEDLHRQVDLCDGLLIPGGFRIFEQDKEVIKYALEKNISVLGICLGMQEFASVYAKEEKILGNIETLLNHKQEIEDVHKVNVDKSSKLYNIVKNDNFIVNSKHRMCIKKVVDLDIVAYSEDGIIEGVEDKNKKFAIGVQWHPECLIDTSEEAKRLFETFIESAKK